MTTDMEFVIHLFIYAIGGAIIYNIALRNLTWQHLELDFIPTKDKIYLQERIGWIYGIYYIVLIPVLISLLFPLNLEWIRVPLFLAICVGTFHYDKPITWALIRLIKKDVLN